MAIKIFFLSLLFVSFVNSCARPSGAQMEIILDTVCVINLYEDGNRALYSRMFSRIREIDRTMTAFENEFQDMFDGMASSAASETLISGVLAVNRQAGIAPVAVRADLLEVLERALYFAELSGGLFDPTIGPLARLWGIGSDSQRIPDDDEIAAALELVNWKDLLIDRQAGTAFLRRQGMALDLGALAKGYAANEAARIAREGGARRGVIDLGGNIFALGWRDYRRNIPWRIGIQDPLQERGEYIGVVSAYDTSVVTSGINSRFFEYGGVRYHHILSTEDGYPVRNGLASVTIVTENSMDADALSTTVFALGFERGKALADSIPGAEAIFIFDDGRVEITEGLEEIFSLLSVAGP